MNRQPEVYELIKQLEYFYNIALNVKANLEDIPAGKLGSMKRFLAFKEQVDGHIADIIDELQHAKNGALNNEP